MSYEAWMKKYYPISASSFDPNKNTLRNVHSVHDRLEAVEHSIKKWSGLRKKALMAHGLALFEGVLTPAREQYLEKGTKLLNIDSGSCALCQLSKTPEGGVDCARCVFSEVMGADCDFAYSKALYDSNPSLRPMLTALRKVRKSILLKLENKE